MTQVAKGARMPNASVCSLLVLSEIGECVGAGHPNKDPASISWRWWYGLGAGLDAQRCVFSLVLLACWAAAVSPLVHRSLAQPSLV